MSFAPSTPPDGPPGPVVLITGASAGLGRALAVAFARDGANVVLAARGTEALEEAAAEVRAAGVEALAVPCDVTDDAAVEALVAAAAERFGRLDVLVNNVGASARRALRDTTPQDFEQLLALNFLTAVRCTRAAMPHLLAQRGSVVNIGSLSGKFATRHMGAYPASKFALAAYSQQLRLELGPEGLHVLLVSTGPIAREQPRTYGAEADAALPAEAARPGGGAKLKAIDPDWLAARIVRAWQRRKPELVVPGKARLLAAIAQLWPGFGDSMLRKYT